MKFSCLLVLAVFLAAGTPLFAETSINGAGASFPYPIYAQWAYKYNQLTGVKINYQSIGSGGGIAQIKARTLDFGGTDAPLKIDELNEHGLIQFPMVTGGVVPIINLKKIENGVLRLTPEVLAGIFLGKITKWNDDAIQALNPDVKLPRKDITVVHRADGSGTTKIFTHYLNMVSEEWNQKVGSGKAVNWPVGVGGKGNEGVASYVRQISGAIGYVEYAYALKNNLSHVQLRNRDGNFVKPTKESFQAAAANADWENAPGFYMFLNNQPGVNTWPITGVTFILIQKQQDDVAKAKEMLKYFNWCFKFGDKTAEDLHYVPIPDSVVKLVENLWKTGIKTVSPVWQ